MPLMQKLQREKILYQIIEIDLESRNQQIEDSKLFPAYKKQKSYLLAGILINDISNYAMLYHVQALKRWNITWRNRRIFSGKGYTPAFAKCNSQAKSDPVQGQ